MNKEVLEKLNALVIAAFGLVAALAWNTAIQEIFKQIFGTASGLWAMIFYAVLVTVIAVWVTMRMASLSEKATKISEKIENKVKSSIKENATKLSQEIEKKVTKQVLAKMKRKK